jgi:ArsR family transcriptional regulator
MYLCRYPHTFMESTADPRSLSQEIHQMHAGICSAMADPWRILLLYALTEHPHSVKELASELDISQPLASRHLKVLRERGLVSAARRGARVEYSLNDPRLIQALDLLREVLRAGIAHQVLLIDTLVPTFNGDPLEAA